MEGIDPKSFEFALTRIDDGFIFENFCKSYLSKILGYEFIPVGGIKDRGIDGLEHLFSRKGHEKILYQFSIEKDCEAKIKKTCNKLEENNIEYDQLTYVTNQDPKKIDLIIDKIIQLYNKPIRIFGVKWLSAHVNDSKSTIEAYKTFIDSYLHEFNKPGKSYVVGNLIDDPRLFVFLRQQWDVYRKDLELDKILADTLILYALEDTDPDKGIIKTEEEIFQRITSLLKYDPKLLQPVVKKRLKVLSKKPTRKIKYHSRLGGYLLPYETRIELQKRNIEDSILHENFKKEVEEKFKNYLKDAEVKVKDCLGLIETLLNQLYYQQGIEFADFILHSVSKESFEKSLPELVSRVVDESSLVTKNRENVKTALLMTIRDVVYNGTHEQKVFLRKLSNTYTMLFLAHCDPKITTFFSSLASNLNIYVCTSILIPAMSEYYLDTINRRHWNLLQSAHEAGISLVINETILHELAAHFKKITSIYDGQYKDCEYLYTDEIDILYIDEIMLRAYFYSKMRGQTSSFSDFVDNFVSPDLRNIEDDLLIWLKDTFGIKYVTDGSLKIKIDQNEFDILSQKLEAEKKTPRQAKTDAKLILTIFRIREMNNEKTDSGVFGFKTWWLSKDVITQRELSSLFEGKYKTSCYIRPDFLYNYISLTPRTYEVDEAYREIFPTLIGINISYHLPKELTDFVHQQIKEHKSKNPSRMKMILRDLVEKIMTDPKLQTRDYVKHFLDERLKELLKKSY
ncbi:MAG: hypothetical protein A2Y66_08830 [Nitrospirae bacterium RBG_13_41_22]|nr:MAG: hypothetical protein A2Y66_08830 [Nitrospirae bacterium RBG_13_41_22]